MKRANARSRVEASGGLTPTSKGESEFPLRNPQRVSPCSPSKKQRKTVKFCFVLNDEEKEKLKTLADQDGRSMGNYLCAMIASWHKEKLGD